MVLKLLWRAYEHVAMVVGLLLLATVCLTWTPFALLLNPLLPEARAKRVGRGAIRGAFRLYLRLLSLLCACRFDLRELQALGRRGEPLVVVANHPSLLDAVILVACLPNAVCVMKARLMHNVLLGAGARMARYIVNDAPLPMIRGAIAELRQGACLIIFPEGTRTVTRQHRGRHRRARRRAGAGAADRDEHALPRQALAAVAPAGVAAELPRAGRPALGGAGAAAAVRPRNRSLLSRSHRPGRQPVA